jgi:hypothetical protein
MMDAMRALLRELVDYAGLFPPAGLSMERAVAAYARHLESGASWALGRFIVPIGRLEEFASEQARVRHEHAWRISVLGSETLEADVRAAGRFNRLHDGRALIESIESKANDGWLRANASVDVPDSIELYCEVDGMVQTQELLSRVAERGWRAKIRTGGITPDAFPDEATILRFLSLCAQLDLPFKATAGLHHPLRCTRPLTYERDAVEGVMHGFVNLFFAATLIRSGVEVIRLEGILEERESAGFRIDEQRIVWRDLEATAAQIEAARATFAKSFGSCSFDEPIDDLRAIGWLQ